MSQAAIATPVAPGAAKVSKGKRGKDGNLRPAKKGGNRRRIVSQIQTQLVFEMASRGTYNTKTKKGASVKAHAPVSFKTVMFLEDFLERFVDVAVKRAASMAEMGGKLTLTKSLLHNSLSTIIPVGTHIGKAASDSGEAMFARLGKAGAPCDTPAPGAVGKRGVRSCLKGVYDASYVKNYEKDSKKPNPIFYKSGRMGKLIRRHLARPLVRVSEDAQFYLSGYITGLVGAICDACEKVAGDDDARIKTKDLVGAMRTSHELSGLVSAFGIDQIFPMRVRPKRVRSDDAAAPSRKRSKH